MKKTYIAPTMNKLVINPTNIIRTSVIGNGGNASSDNDLNSAESQGFYGGIFDDEE